MTKKKLIIGNFVNKTKILSFFEKLIYDLNISIERTYVYLMDGNDNEYLVTFKSCDKDIYTDNLPHSIIMHAKNGCLFSINALNKLIESDNDSDKPNNEVEINWSKYKNKLIILTNGELNIKTLVKIEDKCLLFK